LGCDPQALLDRNPRLIAQGRYFSDIGTASQRGAFSGCRAGKLDLPRVNFRDLMGQVGDFDFVVCADELIPKLKDKGYKGKFIIPLPNPLIVE